MVLHPGITRGLGRGLPDGGLQRPDAPASSGLDRLLDPGTGGACHEIYARTSGAAVAASGLGLGIATGWRRRRPLLWVRQMMLDSEAGVPNTQGLIEFGLNPAAILRVVVRDATAALQAGLEGARFAGLGAVMIELWGRTPAYDLTASRRLALACRASGVPLLLLRCATDPVPSAAETRWHAEALPSVPLAANAPGNPAFLLTLLRHRAGASAGCWRLEWNRDSRCFTRDRLDQPGQASLQPAALSGAVVSFPGDRQGEAQPPLRRAG